MTADRVTIEHTKRKKNVLTTVGSISGKTTSRRTCVIPPPMHTTVSRRAGGVARIGDKPDAHIAS